MRVFAYLLTGIIFGISLFKSEAASWFRIYEMFLFDAFHMYGIIGSALAIGILSIQLIKHFNIPSIYGTKIHFLNKEKRVYSYLIGGIIFGLGWALAGACPGPMFILLGAGYLPIAIVILSAILGTYAYGVFKDKLPH